MTNSTLLALSVAERWGGFWRGNIGEWILTRGLRIALLLIGAILLGSLQQIATVTISSAVNLLIVGLLLVAFVIIALNGIVGLVQGWMRGRTK